MTPATNIEERARQLLTEVALDLGLEDADERATALGFARDVGGVDLLVAVAQGVVASAILALQATEDEEENEEDEGGSAT